MALAGESLAGEWLAGVAIFSLFFRFRAICVFRGRDTEAAVHHFRSFVARTCILNVVEIEFRGRGDLAWLDVCLLERYYEVRSWMKLELSARWQSRLAVWGLVLTGLVCGYGIAQFGGKSEKQSAVLDSNRLLNVVESSGIASSPAWLDSASRGSKVSLASGMISDGVEGIFALDHQTGTMFCWVLDPRTMGLMAEYATNVPAQLGLGINGEFDFVMTTGMLPNRAGQAGNARPAQCVVYVAEGNSGKVGGFSFNWAQPMAARGAGQQGPMNLVFAGTVRSPLATRDQ